MTLPEAFQQAILQAPEDDVPRLVYADWLEENDQPARAEFIRLGCRLASLPENDRRRGPFEDRELALLETHGDNWRAQIPRSLPAGEMRFRRGFLERLDITAEQFLAHANDLFRVAPIVELRLREGAGRLAEIGQHPALQRVRSLELGATGLQASDIADLVASPHLGRLEVLDLRLNYLGDEGVQILAGGKWDSLRRLQLGLNRISQAGLEALLAAQLPALIELDLNNHAPPGSPVFCQSVSGFTMYWNPIDNAIASLIARSPAAARLTALKLDSGLFGMGVGIGNEGCRELAQSPFLASLTLLDLGEGNVTSEGVRVLCRSENLSRLRQLFLHYDPIDDEGLAALGEPCLPALEVLGLACGEYSDKGLARLSASAHRGSLTNLILSECEFGPAGVSALARSPHLTSLAVLALNGNPVGDEGARALADATFAGSLARLYLSHARIGPKGARALAASDPLAGLLELDLRDNRIEAAADLLRQRFGRRVRLEREADS
jgi:uncharacterized protein (TIGR02996 family)